MTSPRGRPDRFVFCESVLPLAEGIEEAGYLGLPRRSPLDLLSPACHSRLHQASTNPAESLKVWVPHRFSADFHAASLTLVLGELVAESSVAPPGDGDGGEFGLAKYG